MATSTSIFDYLLFIKIIFKWRLNLAYEWCSFSRNIIPKAYTFMLKRSLQQRSYECMPCCSNVFLEDLTASHFDLICALLSSAMDTFRKFSHCLIYFFV